IAYYRVAQLFGLHSHAEWLFAPLIEPAFLYVHARYGFNLTDASPEAALRATKTPVLLIHGYADQNIPPSHTQALSRARQENIQYWMVVGALHTQAYSANPLEFERRVTQWFAKY